MLSDHLNYTTNTRYLCLQGKATSGYQVVTEPGISNPALTTNNRLSHLFPPQQTCLASSTSYSAPPVRPPSAFDLRLICYQPFKTTPFNATTTTPARIASSRYLHFLSISSMDPTFSRASIFRGLQHAIHFNFPYILCQRFKATRRNESMA